MTRGLIICGLVAAWAVGQAVGAGEPGDSREILLAAVFSGAAMCGALSVVLTGRTSSRTTSQFAATAALILPCLLGLYLGLYRGVWGATDLADDLSLRVLLRTLALSAVGYALVAISGNLTQFVRELAKSNVEASAAHSHRHVHSRTAHR
jgi:hypothetical protein